MSAGKTVAVVLVVLIILYYILRWWFQSSTDLSKIAPATGEGSGQVIPASKLPDAAGGNDFAYSMWFYVEDWNFRYGEDKYVLARARSDQWPEGGASPAIYMDGTTNNLRIFVACYPSGDDAQGQDMVPGWCDVENFPLQKWVNVIVSLYGRSLDVYVDGKLFRTCVMPGVAKVDPEAAVRITPKGGFKGFTGNFQYWPNAVNPQQAYNIYRAGYGGSIISNLFNKYRVRLQFLEDNKVKGAFEI